jgi:hypothetical protein
MANFDTQKYTKKVFKTLINPYEMRNNGYCGGKNELTA